MVEYKIEQGEGSMVHGSDKPDNVDTARVMLKELKKPPKSLKISNPEAAFELLQEMQYYDRERLKVIHLDIRNKVIHIENISTGSLDSSIAHMREVFKGAILANSAGIIIAHNHPGGNPSPSNEDLAVHKRAKDAGNLIGIPVLDFIIVGKEMMYSGEGRSIHKLPHEHLKG